MKSNQEAFANKAASIPSDDWSLHWCDFMRAEPGSYLIRAHTRNEKRITARIVFSLYDESMRRCGAIQVMSWFNIEKNETCIKVIDLNM